MLAEQFVAQDLAYLNNEEHGPEFFYWLRDTGTQKGEIDFICQSGAEVVPLEVKSTAEDHLKSLFYFCMEKKKRKGIKISLENFEIRESSHMINGEEVHVEITTLPHYALSSLYKVIERQKGK